MKQKRKERKCMKKKIKKKKKELNIIDFIKKQTNKQTKEELIFEENAHPPQKK